MIKYITLLIILSAYMTKANNICFGHDGICTNVNKCTSSSGCLGILNEILRISTTMHDVWQTTISTFGGSWSVFQTQNANWYSNWGTAAICDCNGIKNIFVRQNA